MFRAKQAFLSLCLTYLILYPLEVFRIYIYVYILYVYIIICIYKYIYRYIYNIIYKYNRVCECIRDTVVKE